MSTTIPTYISKNDDADQVCIFINEAADLNFLCLGKVGRSQQFCLAHKDPPSSHCGVAAHAKKFWPETRTFYVPGGIVSGTHPTAKMNPFIHKDNIPIHMLPTYTMGMFPAHKWERLISEATNYNHNDEETKSRVNNK
jgi:hypothetical protein